MREVEKNYVINAIREENGGWSATVQGLKGCVTQARSLHELRQHAREAIATWLGAKHGVDIEPEDIELIQTKFVGLGPSELLREYKSAVLNEKKARDNRARIQKKLTKVLRDKHNISLRDIAEMQGVSHQHVKQLLEGPAPAKD